MKLDKDQKIIIVPAILIAVILGAVIINSLQEKPNMDLGLSKNQKLIDYAFNQNWLFAIIEEKNENDYKSNIFIYKSENSSDNVKWEKTAEYDFTFVSPWKIKIGNLDYTDGPQVVIGVNKATYFDKEVNNRFFVFNWDGEKLYKKWTGTRLGYFLKDFYIMDLLDIKGEELVVIDQNQDGEERVLVYYWMDFGFQLLAESEFYDIIEEVKYVDNNLLELKYRKQGKKITSMVMIKDGWVIEVD